MNPPAPDGLATRDAVRRWGRLRDPAGYPFRAGLHGYYRRDTLTTGCATAAVIHPSGVRPLLEETRQRLGQRPALVWVDRRPRDAARLAATDAAG